MYLQRYVLYSPLKFRGIRAKKLQRRNSKNWSEPIKRKAKNQSKWPICRQKFVRSFTHFPIIPPVACFDLFANDIAWRLSITSTANDSNDQRRRRDQVSRDTYHLVLITTTAFMHNWTTTVEVDREKPMHAKQKKRLSMQQGLIKCNW